MLYDQKDFDANPKKYELFCTATIAKHIVTHEGEQDLPEGTIVGVRYATTARNQLFRRNEPVFAVTVRGQFWGHLYASAMKDFVL